MKELLKSSIRVQIGLLSLVIVGLSTACWFGLCQLTVHWIDFSTSVAIIGLVALVSATTAGAVIVTVWRKVFLPLRLIGRYNIRQATECTAEDCSIMLIPEENIPSGEIGDLMKSRNAMLRQLGQTLRELQENYGKIKRLDKLKDDLSRMIVHDLKNPLAVILPTLDLLEMKNPTTKDQRKLVWQVRKSGADMLAMIQNLLDISKMEEGKLEIKRNPVDLGKLSTRIVREFRAVRAAGGKTITLHVVKRLPAVEGDIDLLSRVLRNLLSNAIKHTQTNGKIELTVAKRSNKSVLVKFKDNGIGIPKEYQNRIFEKFEQVELKDQAQRTGSGLGLTFCKLAVEAHGGRIWVESELGKGSTFFVELPLKIQSEDAQIKELR